MSWEIYYKKLYNKPVSELLKIALDHHPTTGVAYDLGCGTGSDTAYLLKKKWQVIAVDRESIAIDVVKKDLGRYRKLSCQVEDFNTLKMLPCDLIHGTYSFGFSGEDSFLSFWNKLTKTLRKGGIISGELFGDHDDWHKTPRVKTLTRAEFLSIIKGFEVLYFDEEEYAKETALGHMKWWHVYSFVIKKD